MSASLNDLGDVRQVFRPKMANVWAGVILGLALVAGGIGTAVGVVQQNDPKPLRTTFDHVSKYALAATFGLSGCIGGGVLLVWMKRLASHRVSVCDNGFSYFYGGTDEVILWREVDKIDEVFTEEQLKILKVPGAVIRNLDRSFVVHRKDGKQFRFTVNSIDDIPRFADMLEEAQAEHHLPWNQVHQ